MKVKIKKVVALRARQRGQSLAEISVALPFLMLIVVAIIEMGVVFATYISLVSAAREGAIYASMHPELADASCGSTPNPTCVGTNDNRNSGTGTTTLWTEYKDRVRNEVYVAVGENLKAGQIIESHSIAVSRPVIGGITSSCPTGAEAGCPITVTVSYQLHTFTSDISMPRFGRFGLPNYYQIDYVIGMPIR